MIRDYGFGEDDFIKLFFGFYVMDNYIFVL